MNQLPDSISILSILHFADIQERDDTLTHDEARQVLQLIKQNHEADTVGIDFDVIDSWIEHFKSI